MKWKNDRHPRKQTNQRRNKSQKEEEKKKRKSGRIVNGWSDKELCDVESSDLIFSIVSSGMGATVCTAGRFLLVAPLTNDEEEEEEEEAESVAPRRGGDTGGEGSDESVTVTWIKRDKDYRAG